MGRFQQKGAPLQFGFDDLAFPQYLFGQPQTAQASGPAGHQRTQQSAEQQAQSESRDPFPVILPAGDRGHAQNPLAIRQGNGVLDGMIQQGGIARDDRLGYLGIGVNAEKLIGIASCPELIEADPRENLGKFQQRRGKTPENRLPVGIIQVNRQPADGAEPALQ